MEGTPQQTLSAHTQQQRPSASSKLVRWVSEDADEDDEEVKTPRGYTDTSRGWKFCGWGTIVLSFIVIWALIEVILLQVSLDQKHLLGSSHVEDLLQSKNNSDFSKELARAYNEWKLISNKYSNFSEYLVQQKSRESHLRRKIQTMSDESLNLMNQIVVPPAQPAPPYSKNEAFELEWTYLSKEKYWPYVGSDRYLEQFPVDSRAYYNSLAVFPHGNRTRMHGLVGLWPNGTRAFVPSPMPPPIDKFPGGKDKALELGGFYLNLSNALPLDREVADGRQKFCFNEKYDITQMEDVSVIITQYNEYPSTLLRSIHSVLNLTPPPLLREIIIVDDHSNNTENLPGGFIYEYVKTLPKTKILRLGERRGLVEGRLAGAKVAKAPVIVVLDSHIEVNPGWLEPQLHRLIESPKSVVFPQILSLDSETFGYNQDSGIGCFLSFKWMMQERPYFGKEKSATPVPSPSMAGGLFAVRRDWFFEVGGYDEEFSMWGAENVEMAFRVWMCGGRVEGIPCARTYHIYRHGGSGYKSPSNAVRINRVRTARLWMDEWWQVSKNFIDYDDTKVGSFDRMLDLKEDLKCKSFKWYLENVDKTRSGTSIEGFKLMGDLRSKKFPTLCLDSYQAKNPDQEYGLYQCHNGLGSQGFFLHTDRHDIKNMQVEGLCLGTRGKFTGCSKPDQDARWVTVPDSGFVAFAKSKEVLNSTNYAQDFDCLAVNDDKKKLSMKPCDVNDMSVQWTFKHFALDPNIKPLQRSRPRE